jgi:hypothetical protein
MRAGAQARTYFAGFGVSGSLLAAVGAAFVIAGGVLAFDQWPRELSAAPPASVEVASSASATGTRPATGARAVALPPATTALTTTSHRGGRRGTTVPGRATSKRSTVFGDPPAPTGPAATPATPPIGTAPTSTPARAPNPVADTVESTTGTAAGIVRAAGGGVPAIAPVTNAVADTAENAGKLVGGLVRGLTGGR